ETDGEIALKLLKEKGCDKVFVYGAFGKRMDHFLGNLALLGLGKEMGVDVVLMGDEEKISLGFGHVKFVPQKKGNISLVPYGERVHIINSKGLEYPLDDLVLTKNDTRGISNLSFADEVEFFVKEGQVLILETWRPE
ncbi:MAG: thiamine diphosphokinase, partial [Clostridia bacterium]|nr:thiamine diphosphokinase [Clostridia bacterium]